MKKMIAFLLVTLLVLAYAAVGVVAQDSDSGIETDEDALFGSEDDMFSDPLIEDADETGDGDGAPSRSLLVSETVEIGGRYSFQVETSAGWNDPTAVFTDTLNPDSVSMSTSLSTRLFFDARPDENFRVFGKMTASYPFATDDATGREFQDVFHVEELFSDFNWNDTVFFRGGKQTLNWGVGYFYSPADLLNIAEIDPEDPEAELEGPVALRANIPLGVDNLYFYALPTAGDEPFDLGLAAKGELVVGPGEIGVGVIYQRDVSPAAMATVSTSFGDFDLFGEGVVSYGSNRTFVVETGGFPGLETEDRNEEFFFNATAGFRWSDSVGDTSSTVNVVAQYLYNGEGYSDPSVITDNPAAIGALLASGALSTSDLRNTGKHYTAANAGWSDLFGSEINANVLWIQNFTDMSAMVTPSLGRTIVDKVNLTLAVPMMFGEEGDEFTPFGDSLSLRLSLSLGGGSF